MFKSNKSWFCDNSPTLDRINNNIGYIKGNVKVVSWKGNALKRDATIDQLKMVIKYMENNLE